MSRLDAPLYVAAHDLCGWLLRHLSGWPPHALLRQPISEAACALLEAISLALTFPDIRAAQLQRADCAIVRLRVLLRLAQEDALLSTRQLHYVAGLLLEIGRMVGGWRKRVSGARPVAAPTA